MTQKQETVQRAYAKVIHTDNSLEFGRACEIYLGIIVRQHLTVQRQLVLLKERYAELRKGLLQCCCNQVWMQNGGWILWSVIAVLETFKTSCLMGRHLMKGGSECPLTDQ